MYEAIFIDIDGTLRDNNKNISMRTKKAIKNIIEKGIHVVLSSGRPIKYTEKISKECDASKYIIASDGGIIYNLEQNNIIYKNVISKQAIIELYKIAEQADVRILMDAGENRVVNKLKYLDGSETILNMDIETFVEKNDVQSCAMSDTNFEKMEKLQEKIEKIKDIEIKQKLKSFGDVKGNKDEIMYFFIENKESSKGNAIKKFCEILNIDLKNTIAIGDDYNDISMFKVVGHSVVMENANNEVKKYADEITMSNEREGVAIFLENLLKKFDNNKM